MLNHWRLIYRKSQNDLYFLFLFSLSLYVYIYMVYHCVANMDNGLFEFWPWSICITVWWFFDLKLEKAQYSRKTKQILSFNVAFGRVLRFSWLLFFRFLFFSHDLIEIHIMIIIKINETKQPTTNNANKNDWNCIIFFLSFCYKTTFSQRCMNNSRNFSSSTKRTDGSSSDDESGEKHSSTSDSSHSSDEKSKSDGKGK